MRPEPEDPTIPPPALRLALEARPENVGVVRQVLGGAAAALGMDSRAVDDLRLALSEACTNVVVHAYENPARETFEVDAWSDGGLLHVTVRDRGAGRSAGLGPSPGLGLGLPIIRELTEEVAFTDDGGPSAQRHEVRMTFVLAPAA
ncbi:MAG: ATP-binding protein [Baekduia sp.]